MPAAERGASRVSATPRPKAAPGKGQASPKRAPAKGAAPARADGRGGASPKLILLTAAGVLVAAVTATLATGGRGEALANGVTAAVDGQFGQAGFRLKAVHVQGASKMATPDIVRAAAVSKDQPLLGMDLNALRERVEQVGWVKEAKVVRLLPDTLVIAVEERRQLAVWQHAGRTVVIDEKGQAIPEADPARFPTLPLVVGAGGAQHAGEILPVIAQRPKLMQRMEALVRVDDRRWDLPAK